MNHPFRWSALALGCTLLLAPAGDAPAAPKAVSPVTITNIDVQVQDRMKGAVVPMSEMSDPYGMNVSTRAAPGPRASR
jgi:hypothetical protein